VVARVGASGKVNVSSQRCGCSVVGLGMSCVRCFASGSVACCRSPRRYTTIVYLDSLGGDNRHVTGDLKRCAPAFDSARASALVWLCAFVCVCVCLCLCLCVWCKFVCVCAWACMRARLLASVCPCACALSERVPRRELTPARTPKQRSAAGGSTGVLRCTRRYLQEEYSRGTGGHSRVLEGTHGVLNTVCTRTQVPAGGVRRQAEEGAAGLHLGTRPHPLRPARGALWIQCLPLCRLVPCSSPCAPD
jgi:hypothetical protein